MFKLWLEWAKETWLADEPGLAVRSYRLGR